MKLGDVFVLIRCQFLRRVTNEPPASTSNHHRGRGVGRACLNTSLPAELAGSMLFLFPLVLCIRQRSKWLLWGTSTVATLLTVGGGNLGFPSHCACPTRGSLR